MTWQDPAETFRQEAHELLEQLEQALLDLAQQPGRHELIDTAFRALHTIKGSGAMFGFEAVAAFTHDFETAFDLLRKSKAPPGRDLISVALQAKDHIRTLVQDPGRATAATGEAILSDLHAIMGAPAASHEHEAPAAAPEIVTWRLRFRLPPTALVNGTNPLLLLDELRALGRCIVTATADDIPPLDEMDPEACYLRWEIVLATTQSRAAVEEVFLFVLDDMALEIEQIGGTAPSEADLRGESAVGPVPPCLSPREADAPRDAAKATASMRVPAERLDQLMDRVGELVIAQARLSQLAAASTDANVKSIAEEIERLASGLRDTTMSIRMVPIGSLFSRFRRVVHDLSRDLSKQVELITAGEETELDKTMIERLADPLVHLIRNAIDHGIEAPPERAASGKPATGRVRLTARHSGAEVLVSFSDDGRGLNRERILEKCREQGLLAADVAPPDAELFQFVFHPGFSTAREVSAVSGRGVGMDVVKRAIEALRGTIDLVSRPNQGTEVTLRLPLTLAIIEGLLVRVGRGHYALPLSAVEECVELPKADARSRGRRFLNIRGALVPFLCLRDIFSVDLPVEPYQKVVIVSTGELRVGLLVDQIIGNHQTVIKSLSKLHADVGMFSGATILGDGTVALVLDIPHLVQIGQLHEQRLRSGQKVAA
jgi:two-component system chemotaxis sensor kinase CheA